MKAVGQRVATIAMLAFGVACGDTAEPELGSQSETVPASQTEVAAPQLETAYRLSQVNDQRPPMEWPEGSGSTLEAATLELDSGGRYALQFIVGAGPLGSEFSGSEGTYTVSADTLYLTPDAGAGELMSFQYELTGSGELRLRDAAQDLWIYTPRMMSR